MRHTLSSFRTLLLTTTGCALLFPAASPLSASTACSPSYTRLFDSKGNRLPLDTPFIASVEIAPKTAIVFRPVEGDIQALITRLRSQGETDGKLLTVAFWQGVRCRVVDNRCTGECPLKDGKKLRCLADRNPNDPTPPHDPDHKKKHGKNDGKPKSFFMPQVSSLRCQCQ